MMMMTGPNYTSPVAIPSLGSTDPLASMPVSMSLSTQSDYVGENHINDAGCNFMMMLTGPNYTSPVPIPSPSSTDLVASMPVCMSLSTASDYLGENHSSDAGPPLCVGCTQPILDQFILQVQGHMWHSSCLRCCMCNTPLSHMCYSGHSELYCQEDFFRLYGAQCSSCNGIIPPTDIVRRAQNNIYHMDCFRCSVCQRELCTGDEFYLWEDGQLFCKEDYLPLNGNEKNEDNQTSTSKKDSKYNKEIEELFQHYYTQNSNPRRDVVEKIAMEVGIESSEVWSWFQNRQAKNGWKSSSHEDISDMAARVIAPPGGYPLPIVNKANTSEQLPEDIRQNVVFNTQTSAHTIPSHTLWTEWDELMSNDFVPPNIDLVSDNLENGEVIMFPILL